MKGCISMSIKELGRLETITKVCEKVIKQSEAADFLGLSLVQVKRLVRCYKTEGALGLISKKRGATGNHRLSEAVKTVVKDLIQAHYEDYGPTLAHEKLSEVHQLKISVSSVRAIMIKEGIWTSKRAKKKRIFQYRERRSREGELEHMDGSHHDWFEGRGPKCW